MTSYETKVSYQSTVKFVLCTIAIIILNESYQFFEYNNCTMKISHRASVKICVDIVGNL